MRKVLSICGVVCLFAATFAGIAAAQEVSKANGNWDVIVKEPDKNVNQKMMLQQQGANVTGTYKTDHGDLPVAGTVTGNVLRAEVTDQDGKLQIHATVLADSLNGTIRIGKNEFIWSAQKSK